MRIALPLTITSPFSKNFLFTTQARYLRDCILQVYSSFTYSPTPINTRVGKYHSKIFVQSNRF